MKRFVLPAVAAAGAIALAVGAAVLANSLSALADDVKESASKLRNTPGLRKDAAGAAEDELIAYWESWEADKQVSSCMEQLGFAWLPEGQYPEDEIVGIAEHLRLDLRPKLSEQATRNEDQNTSNIPTSRQDGEACFLALYGLTEQGLAEAEYDNELEVGGCWAAGDQTPGVWAAVDSILDAYPEYLTKADSDPRLLPTREALSACTAKAIGAGVESLGELEELASPDPVLTAEQSCQSQLEALQDARGELADALAYADHAELCDAQTRTYTELASKVRNDQEFLSFLMAEAQAIQAQ